MYNYSSSTRSRDSGIVTSEDAIHGLKTELERCLKKCQEKSQLVIKLQTELKSCRSSLAENDVRLEMTEKELKDLKVILV